MSEARDDFSFRSDAYAWYVVFVLCVANIVGQLDRQIISLLVEPIKADFGITDTEISLLQGFAFALFFVLIAVPIGRLADTRSRRGVILVGAVMWSAATAACGLARSFWQLFFARMAVGVGEATLGPASFSLISDYFPREKLGRALAFFIGSSFVGTGIALAGGGALVGWATSVGHVDVPVLGTLAPWQLAFVMSGLVGMGLWLLVPTIREPARREASGAVRVAERVPVRAVLGFVGANRGAFAAIYVGFPLLAAMNFALGAWVPSFFIRTYGWSAAQIGYAYGLYTMVFGSLGVLAGGWLTDLLQRRGHRDANLRAPLFACIPALPCLVLMPLAGSAEASLALLAPVAFLGTVPFGAGPAAVPLISPNRMRAQLVAVYYLLANLVGVAFGPWIVAFFTDHVFGDPLQIGRSLAIACPLLLVAGAAVMVLGLAPLRRTVEAQLAGRAAATDERAGATTPAA